MGAQTLAFVRSRRPGETASIFVPSVPTLLQLASIGALVLYQGRNRRLALFSVALLAISPLFSEIPLATR